MQLKSERIYLRFFRMSDAPEYFETISESRKELEPFMTWLPFTKSVKDVENFIRLTIRRRGKREGYNLGIFDLKSRTNIGGIGLHAVNQENNSAEIGYLVRTAYAGHGVATEAAALVVQFGFRSLKLHRIILRAAVDNPASNRVAEKLGFRHDGVQRHEQKLPRGWVDLNYHTMLDTEFRKNQGQIKKLISK